MPRKTFSDIDCHERLNNSNNPYPRAKSCKAIHAKHGGVILRVVRGFHFTNRRNPHAFWNMVITTLISDGILEATVYSPSAVAPNMNSITILSDECIIHHDILSRTNGAEKKAFV